MEIQCHYCYAGIAKLDRGEFICDNCGMILEVPEEYTIQQPFYNKITAAETDLPITTKTRKIPDDVEEVISGNRTVLKKKPKPIDQRKLNAARRKKQINLIATRLRHEQKDMVKYAIDDICEKLGLNPEKALNKFESYYKRSPTLTSRGGHKRPANVVAAGIIYKVYRNNVTIRQLKKIAKVGGKSLQKILRIIE